ncbi:MAG: hypothetical protein VKJ86_11815 [Synechococcus sp.]|nr:hypothetical protein [Synechococcus sp.]
MTSSRFSATERLASVKTAVVGGATAGLLGLGLLLVHRLVGSAGIPLSFGSEIANLTLLINIGAAALAGALFALTYRYAVRTDENSQLKGGVVLAFTLVRGVAQVDAGSAIAQSGWPFVAACGENLMVFGLTAVVLNLGIQRGWLTPFR